MGRCSILGCKSNSERKESGISLHSFPADDVLRKNWIAATGRSIWTPKTSSRICSKHFAQDMLFKKKKMTILYPYAVPLLDIKTCGPSTTSSVSSHDVKIDVSTEIDSVKETATSTKQRPLIVSLSSSRAGSFCVGVTGAEERATGRGSPSAVEYVDFDANKGSQCSLCKDVIEGHRTVCVQCPTCLCFECSAVSPHDHHYMLRVPAGRDQEEVLFLLNKLRALITTPLEARGSEVETLNSTHTSAATDIEAQLVECKQEVPDEEAAGLAGQEEPELLIDYTTTDALDPIGLDIKQEDPDDTEDVTFSLNNAPSIVGSKRKWIADPQTPGRSRPKRLIIKIPCARTVPGANSNIQDNCDLIENKSSLQKKIGTEDGKRGRRRKDMCISRVFSSP